MVRIIVLASLLSVGFAIRLHNYTDCSEGAKILYVNFPQCKKEPCALMKGTNYTVSVGFISSEQTQTATAEFQVLINGYPFYTSPPVDSCKYDDVKCPVKKGAKQVYRQNFTVPGFARPMKFDAKWYIQDDNKKPLICTITPMNIVS
ncbi:hypothetical protein ACJMK2_003929 [Sinanodonta woodiana]|uniref:MD-2-related lipid-recognition domain-containing protein n=1 Tax=Sinanodonta woodiana TaxID=1069815 RepID=A0ABD3XZN4_SINWO